MTRAAKSAPADLIPRFGVSERLAHWLLAAAFASMLASGVFMGGLGPLHHRAVLVVHVGSAVVLAVRCRIARPRCVAAAGRSRRQYATSARWMPATGAGCGSRRGRT